MKVLFLSLLVLLAVIPQAYAQHRDEPLFPVGDEGRTIYIDRKGNVAFTVPYPGSAFSEGLAHVTVNNQTGYIDQTGKLVIGPIPYSGHNFSNGLAMVESEEFDEAGRFSDLAAVRLNDLWGFIDKRGKFIVTPAYKQVQNFSEGLAAVMVN